MKNIAAHSEVSSPALDVTPPQFPEPRTAELPWPVLAQPGLGPGPRLLFARLNQLEQIHARRLLAKDKDTPPRYAWSCTREIASLAEDLGACVRTVRRWTKELKSVVYDNGEPLLKVGAGHRLGNDYETARWEGRQHIRIPNWIMWRPELTPADKLVYSGIKNLVGGGSKQFTVDTLCERVSIPRTTAKRSIGRLEALKLIVVMRIRLEPEKNAPNLWRLPAHAWKREKKPALQAASGTLYKMDPPPVQNGPHSIKVGSINKQRNHVTERGPVNKGRAGQTKNDGDSLSDFLIKTWGITPGRSQKIIEHIPARFIQETAEAVRISIMDDGLKIDNPGAYLAAAIETNAREQGQRRQRTTDTAAGLDAAPPPKPQSKRPDIIEQIEADKRRRDKKTKAVQDKLRDARTERESAAYAAELILAEIEHYNGFTVASRAKGALDMVRAFRESIQGDFVSRQRFAKDGLQGSIMQAAFEGFHKAGPGCFTGEPAGWPAFRDQLTGDGWRNTNRDPLYQEIEAAAAADKARPPTKGACYEV